MIIRTLALTLVFAASLQPLHAADLVRNVRLKISAGDLATGLAMAEDYKKATGVDEEYLNAIGWIARGAEMLDHPEIARVALRELHRELKSESKAMLTPYGAAIEVEGRLLLKSDGRGAALRYFEEQLARAEAPSLRSRIRKNINLLTLEGQSAPPLDASQSLEKLRGKPVLLYLFAEWCGDCKSQAPSLARVWEKYKSQGLAMIAATRFYSTPTDEKPMSTAEEKTKVEKVWSETYTGLADVPVIINNDSMIHYGGSATPTFVLVDRRGIVRTYSPTRMSEAELSRRIEVLLAEEL